MALLLGVMTISSCVSDVEDAFDTTPSERVNTTIESTRSILEAAPNGWRMEYYGDTSYGGYNVFMKFEGDSVTVGSEKVGSTHNAGVDANGNALLCKSHYKFENSQGVILSLDEFNDIFHYFSDPKNADYGTNGDGFYGDFEFRVQSACADSIILQGKKHQDVIRMYPMATDMSWGDYIAKVNETENLMTSSSYEFTVEGSDSIVPAQIVYRRLVFSSRNEAGETVTTTAPYCVTAEGFVLYKPVTINGSTITGFELGTRDDYFAAKASTTSGLVPYLSKLVESLQTGMWFLDYEDMGEHGQSKWDSYLTKIQKTPQKILKSKRMYWAFIGQRTSTKVGFNTAIGSEEINQLFNFTSLNEAGDSVKITWNSQSNKSSNDKQLYNNYGIKELIEPFVGTRGRTFKLKADYQRHPSYIILEDVDDPTNVIKAWANQVNYPMGDRDKED